MTKDYIKNRAATEELVTKIKNWYHRRGIYNFRIWVEKQYTKTNGTEYFVRSNLKFNVDNIKRGLLE